MKWSKLKTMIESRFAPSVRGKVHLYTTNYGCSCGRAWVTYQKEQIANFETILNFTRKCKHRHPTNEHDHVIIADDERAAGKSVERGEFSRFDLHAACWSFLNSSIEDALASTNPLIQGLAFLDQRFGKRRLFEYPTNSLHPLAKELLEIRKKEEGSEAMEPANTR